MRVACVALWIGLCVSAAASSPEAQRLFKEALKAEKAHDVVHAYVLYSQAIAQDPYNVDYWWRRELLRVPATLASDTGRQPLRAPLPPVVPPPPSEREPLPPPELRPLPGRMDLELRGDARALFTQVAGAYKLNVMFDPDYQAGPAIAFRVTDADYRHALHILELATGSFCVPMSDKLLLVARDTPQKRQELEPAVSVSVPLPQALTAQEAQDIMRAVQQAFTLTRVAYDSQHSAILLRDRLSRVRPAQELTAQLAGQRTMVSIEVEFLEQARNSSLSYGFSLQNMFALTPTGSTLLSALGAAAKLYTLGITGAQFLAQSSRSSGFSLFRTNLRSLDGQEVSLHVGDRYPIITGRMTSSGGTGQLIIPPAVTFEDLGLVLKVTPHVNDGGELTLTLDAEFKALSGQVIEELPVIVNRKLQSTVRLREGEWAIVAGLLNSSEARTAGGLAGFSRIPIAGPLFSKNTRDVSTDQVLVVLKPTIFQVAPRAISSQAVATGSEPRPRIPF